MLIVWKNLFCQRLSSAPNVVFVQAAQLGWGGNTKIYVSSLDLNGKVAICLLYFVRWKFVKDRVHSRFDAVPGSSANIQLRMLAKA